MYPTCHGLWPSYKAWSIIKSLTSNISSLTWTASCPESDGLSPACKQEQACVLIRKHWGISQRTISLCGCRDSHVSGSGRRGMSKEVKSMEEQLWSSLGKPPSSQEKRKGWYSALGYCASILKDHDLLCIREFLEKSISFTILPLFPTIRNNHILQMSVDYGLSEATFLENQVSALLDFCERAHLYTLFQGKKGHSAPYL